MKIIIKKLIMSIIMIMKWLMAQWRINNEVRRIEENNE